METAVSKPLFGCAIGIIFEKGRGPLLTLFPEMKIPVGGAMLRANMWNYVGNDKYIYSDRYNLFLIRLGS